MSSTAYHPTQVYYLRQHRRGNVGSHVSNRKRGSKTERVFKASLHPQQQLSPLDAKRQRQQQHQQQEPRPPSMSQRGSLSARFTSPRRSRAFSPAPSSSSSKPSNALHATNALLSRELFALHPHQEEEDDDDNGVEQIWDEWDEDDVVAEGALLPYEVDHDKLQKEQQVYDLFPANIMRAIRAQERVSRARQKRIKKKPRHQQALMVPFDFNQAADTRRQSDTTRYELVRDKAAHTRKRHFKNEVARKTKNRMYATLLKPLRSTRDEKSDRQLIAGSKADYTDFSKHLLLTKNPLYREKHAKNQRVTKIFEKYVTLWKSLVVTRPRQFYQNLSKEELEITQKSLLTTIVKSIKRKRAARQQEEQTQKSKAEKEQEVRERKERQRKREEKKARQKAIALATETALQRERADKATRMLQQRMEAEKEAAELREREQQDLLARQRERIEREEEQKRKEQEKYLLALASASKQYQTNKAESPVPGGGAVSSVKSEVMASNDPLVLAVKHSVPAAEVDTILKQSSNFANERQEYVNRADKNGSTCIFHCAWNGTFEILEVLLKHKANVNHTNVRGNLALHLACERSKSKVIEMLIMAGSGLDAENSHHKRPFNMFQGDDETRLRMLQLMENSAKRFMASTKAPLTVNLKAYQVGFNALSKYVAKKSRAMQEYYAAHPPVDKHPPRPPSVLQLLPELLSACDVGDAKVVRGILERVKQEDTEAMVNCVDDVGTALLTGAVTRGFTDVAEVLIEFKADVAATNATGNTPLHYACQQDDTASIALLLANKASPVMKNRKGKQCYEVLKSFPDAELKQANLVLELARKYHCFPLRSDIQKMKDYIARKQQAFEGLAATGSNSLPVIASSHSRRVHNRFRLPHRPTTEQREGLSRRGSTSSVDESDCSDGSRRGSEVFDPLNSSGLELMLTEIETKSSSPGFNITTASQNYDLAMMGVV